MPSQTHKPCDALSINLFVLLNILTIVAGIILCILKQIFILNTEADDKFSVLLYVLIVVGILDCLKVVLIPVIFKFQSYVALIIYFILIAALATTDFVVGSLIISQIGNAEVGAVVIGIGLIEILLIVDTAFVYKNHKDLDLGRDY
nr:hypothetical transcript [Hymenolepis microstoma]